MYPYNSNGQLIRTDAKETCYRKFIAHLQISAANAVVSAPAAVITAFATSGTVVTTVATGFTQPGCSKNLTLTAGGTNTDVKAVQVIINGTNYNDEVINEVMPAFTVDTLGIVTGLKAFKTVTSVVVPAMDGNGVTISVGVGEVLGLPYLLPRNTIRDVFLNNVKEATAATVTTSATVLCSNTVKLNSTLNGTAVDIYVMV